MVIIDAQKNSEVEKYFQIAAQLAQKSLCLRANCAAVIVKDGRVIGEGYNSPPLDNPYNRTCLNEYEIPQGFRHDRTCCMHAEQRAIQDGLKNGNDLNGSEIFFCNIDKEGNMTRAKEIKCAICSRACLDAGISNFYLYFDDGIHCYDTVEYNKLSYQYKTPLKNNG